MDIQTEVAKQNVASRDLWNNTLLPVFLMGIWQKMWTNWPFANTVEGETTACRNLSGIYIHWIANKTTSYIMNISGL